MIKEQFPFINKSINLQIQYLQTSDALGHNCPTENLYRQTYSHQREYL